MLTDLDVRLSGALGSVKKGIEALTTARGRERGRRSGVAGRRGREVQARGVRRAERARDRGARIRLASACSVYLAAFVAFDLASQIQSVAIAWQVYSVRHSAFDLGLVGLVLFTPSLLLAPVTGLVADRVDRRRIIAAASVVQLGVCGALIALGGRHGAGTLWC